MNKTFGFNLMSMPEEEGISLLETLQQDSLFLKQWGLMDYSLLLVIENFKVDNDSVISSIEDEVEA